MKSSLILLFTIYTSVEATSQTRSFQAFPDDSARLYQFDLAKNFFANESEECIDRQSIIKSFEKLVQQCNGPKQNANSLFAIINTYDSLSKKIAKHISFFSLAGAINLSTNNHFMKLDSITKAMSTFTLAVNKTVYSISPGTFKEFKEKNTGLAQFEPFYNEIHRDKSLSISEKESAFIDDITPNLISWQGGLFQTTLNSTSFKPVKTPEGELKLPSNANQILNHSNRDIRKQGYLNNLEGLKDRKNIYAFALLGTIRGRNKLARLRGYEDFPEQFYQRNYLNDNHVRHLLKILRDSAIINKRFELALIENIKKIGVSDTVFLWDRQMPDPKAVTPRFTITEASNIILNSTKPLGDDYYEEMSKLLNPNNGRLDMVNRPNRQMRPGFSNGAVGFNSTFFQGNYEGYTSDVVIFGHEAGHAVQNMLMDKNKVNYIYASGPGYFTESFAHFNELILLDYLISNSSSQEYKKYFLRTFLDQATDLFKNALDVTYELSLYDSVPPGTISNAHQLEEQMQKIGRQFSVWFDPQYDNEMQWVNKVQLVTNPLYRLNYLYSKLLAINYFIEFKKSPQVFIPKYQMLLKNGYNDEPEKLLQKFLNMSLKNDKLIFDAIDLVKTKVVEFEQLY